MFQVIFKAAAVILLGYFLLFFGLSDVGLIGPDEPRYASIGREMAFTGDWVTPRLWEKPWFEKPALIYWMTGLAFRAGLDENLAPRLPIALASGAFLVFFGIWLRREFGPQAAWFGTAVLATTAGWLAFSRISTTDLPLSVAFGASMLVLLPWIAGGGRGALAPAGILLGIAILAKGLVPLVLAAPVVWFGRRRVKDLLVIGGFAFATAAPWYVLCLLENGRPFLEEFFLRHHFGRFYSDELQHVQPLWFYVPVLLAGLLPWTPLLVLLGNRGLREDRRVRFLISVAAFGFLFFSLSTNKLPGYLLPLFPMLAAVLGLGLARARGAAAVLVVSAALLSVAPLVAGILPEALARGLSRSTMPPVGWAPPLLAAALCAAVWLLERRKRRGWTVALITVAAVAGAVYLQAATFPILDRDVSTRSLWEEVEPVAARVCIEDIHRNWRYGLNYYSLEPLPACSSEDRPLHVRQLPGEPARLSPR